jgi:hypothetical protein
MVKQEKLRQKCEAEKAKVTIYKVKIEPTRINPDTI